MKLPRLPRLLRKLSISFVVLVLLLIGVELGLRMFGNVPPPVLVYDAQIGRRYQKNFEGAVFSGESARKVQLRFNALGLRFGEVPKQKPEGTKRVLVLGDSMIAGIEVEEQDTACKRLEAMLAERYPEHTWEVLNFGVAGSSTGQQLVLYQTFASQYEADLVLLSFFTGNDLADNSTRLSRHRRIRFDVDENNQLVREAFPTLRQRVNGWLHAESHLYTWQKRFFRGIKNEGWAPVSRPAVSEETVAAADEPSGSAMSAGVVHASESPTRVADFGWHGYSVRNSEWVYHTGQHPEADYAWRVTGAELQALSEAVRADGRPFAVFLMPESLQVHDDAFAALQELAQQQGGEFDREHPVRKLRELCEPLGVSVFDTLPAVRAAAPAHSIVIEDQWLFWGGFNHLNEKGHQAVAEGVFAGLLDSALLP